MHLRWNASSPTANTSSSSRMSASTCDRDREAEPHVHPRRVRAHGQVDEALELGEGDDLVEPLADVAALEPVDRAAEEDVLAAGEVGVEACAELEQRADRAADLDLPVVGAKMPAISRAASSCPSRFGRRTRPTRPARRRTRRPRSAQISSGAAHLRAQDRLLEREVPVRVYAEAARDVPRRRSGPVPSRRGY